MKVLSVQGLAFNTVCQLDFRRDDTSIFFSYFSSFLSKFSFPLSFVHL